MTIEPAITKAPCRVCGSHKYGSRYAVHDGVEHVVRNCHGRDRILGNRCIVRWIESEDWRHFLDEDGLPFSSKAAYDAAVETWRMRSERLAVATKR